jgi:hypothetical protein
MFLMGLRLNDCDAMRKAVEASAYCPVVVGDSAREAQHAFR